jgi:hypothetical protein
MQSNGMTMAALLVGLACTGAEPAGPDEPALPPGAETSSPFPIDRGDDGPATPGTYKGLPLRLVDQEQPIVLPVDGVIGVVCVGMSNAAQECADFMARRQGEYAAEVNSAVRIVNCAVGGHAIERWIDPAFDATLWDACRTQRLPQAGVRIDQVLVLYHKAANQFTLGPGGMPRPTYPASDSDYQVFLGHLTSFAARVRAEFPAVRAVYTSSRSYGGFAGTVGRGEPLSYEEGHALNTWLASHPVVDGVWYGWGGYLWAPDCAAGITNGGGVCYTRDDYQADGIHPATGARAKVSRLLHDRFRSHAWYAPP